jgi:hypothetical protein
MKGFESQNVREHDLRIQTIFPARDASWKSVSNGSSIYRLSWHRSTNSPETVRQHFSSASQIWISVATSISFLSWVWIEDLHFRTSWQRFISNHGLTWINTIVGHYKLGWDLKWNMSAIGRVQAHSRRITSQTLIWNDQNDCDTSTNRLCKPDLSTFSNCVTTWIPKLWILKVWFELIIC